MKVVVVSPHLDDAVLSIGATMHSLSRRGADVELVTVFGGDADGDPALSYWDAKRGLADKAAVIEARRQEDADAARVVGAHPIWLPFDDIAYVSRRDPDAIWEQLAPLLVMASMVLVPGWPLLHADHRFTTVMLLQRLQVAVPLGFYVEMPYAATPAAMLRVLLRRRSAVPLTHALAKPLSWDSSYIEREDLVAKRTAVACYRGEVESLGRDAKLGALHDRIWRCERIATVDGAEQPPMLFGSR